MIALRPRALTGLLALPLLAGCGDTDAGAADPTRLADAGYASLGSSDFEGALDDFERALGALEPGAPGFVRAAMGKVEALIHLDAGRARDEFLALAAGYPDAVGTREFKTVGGKLTSEKRFEEAISVLHAGLEAYAEDPGLQAMLDRVAEESERAGDAGALDALRGLGYLGSKP